METKVTNTKEITIRLSTTELLKLVSEKLGSEYNGTISDPENGTIIVNATTYYNNYQPIGPTGPASPCCNPQINGQIVNGDIHFIWKETTK